MPNDDFYCHMCRQMVSRWHRIPPLKGLPSSMDFYKRICINCWPVYRKANDITPKAGN